MRVEIPDEAGGNVISIEVARRGLQERRMRQECGHQNILVDPLKPHVVCRDCGAEIVAVAWIAMLAEHWERIQRLTAEHQAAAETLKKRSRVKCQHCGEMTPVIKS